MASRLYPKFTDLLRKWPAADSKFPQNSERHLGLIIRSTVAAKFPQGPISKVVDEEEVTKIYDAYNRLANDVHKERYSRKFPNTSSSGLTKEDCVGVSMSDVFFLVKENAKEGEGVRGNIGELKAKIKNLFKKE